MTTDFELETWQREWQEHTEPLPELRKKIKRQNRQTLASIVAIIVCLIAAAIWAILSRSYFAYGLATGIAVAGVAVGSYGWWVRRGAWKPTAQTTLAYAQLSFKRAVAKVRTLRFMFWFLLAAIVLLGGFLGWNWSHFRARDGVIIAAMTVELLYFKRLEKRKQVEIEETRKLVEAIKD